MTSWPGEFFQNESIFFCISPFQDLMNHYELPWMEVWIVILGLCTQGNYLKR